MAAICEVPMSPLVIRHPCELSLVGVLCDVRDERRDFVLQPSHAVIILSHAIRALNLMKAETLSDLEMRRASVALMQDLRLQVSRECLRGELP